MASIGEVSFEVRADTAGLTTAERALKVFGNSINQTANQQARWLSQNELLKTQLGAIQVQLNNANKRLRQQDRQIKKLEDTTKRATRSTKALGGATTDLAKSVQVALGPLSGVASRITAITSLANRNTAALAGLIGGFIALGASAFKSIKVGAQFETEFKQLEARVRSTGQAAGFTAEQLAELGRQLGRDTLANANGARQAILKLLTATNLAGDNFERALELSQDLADTGFGNLSSNAQRLARVLQNPIRNLETLRRVNVTFDEDQKRLIQTLVNTNQLYAAQEIILNRLADVVGGNARAAADSLAGAFDTLLERIREAAEESALQSQAVEETKNNINDLNAELAQLIDNGQLIRRFGRATALIFGSLSKVIVVLAKNIDLVAGVLTGLAGGVILTSLIRGFIALAGALRTFGAAVIALNAAKALGAFKKNLGVLVGSAATLAAAFIILQGRTDELEDTLQKGAEAAGRLGAAVIKGLGDAGDPIRENVTEIDKVNKALRKATTSYEIITNRVGTFQSELDPVVGKLGKFDESVIKLADDLGVLDQFLGREFDLEIVQQLQKLNQVLETTAGVQRIREQAEETSTAFEKWGRTLDRIDIDRQLALASFSGDELTKSFEVLDRSVRQANQALLESDEILTSLRDAAQSTGDAFADYLLEGGASALETLADIAEQTVRDIIAAFFRLAVVGPIINSVFGTNEPTLAQSALGGLLGLGTSVASSGLVSGSLSAGVGGTGPSGVQLARLSPGGAQGQGLQRGGSFVIPGSGGTDRTRVAFNATPGETVTVTPRGQGGGAVINNIQIINNTDSRVSQSGPSRSGPNEFLTKIQIDRAVSEAVGSQGATARTLRNQFNISPRTARR